MSQRASGTFEVGLTPHDVQEAGSGSEPVIGKSAIVKQFDGDLQAASRGEMLAVGTRTPGSAGYVAMEWVSGILHGRSGRFALQHNGTMIRGAPALSVTVVPDSGTGELAGISGTMIIEIVDGKHRYAFDYTFAALD